MGIRSYLGALSPRAVRAAFWIRNDLGGFVRLHFLSAAEQSGLIDALDTPQTSAQLAARLGLPDDSILVGLLDVGVAVGELGFRNGRYRRKGARIRTIAKKSGDPLRAMVIELADYHSSVYLELPERMRSGVRGNYLNRYDEVIARSSVFMTPYIARFVRQVVTETRANLLLEIGCGTGIYLKAAAEASPTITGIGIDMSERVVELARKNLGKWGFSERFRTECANINDPNPDLGDSFDLVTLHNNVYYFAEDARAKLFAELRNRLRPGGRLVLVSLFKGPTTISTDLDLILRATVDNYPLPERETLTSVLTEAGFTDIRFSRLIPAEPLFGVVAHAR
ncbi:methyltransferase domain-containing protein [Mycolicibacterium farcinogenes]|uniref:class I SAM-dependent methyltransferase n=1 Tax=Mycolicibacterium farcinogenes TaxID=1802 RepID=UPI001C8D3C0F|nr:class I SAM-dependent methyltransferase [Mycolicibacterium farcinogenes]QZH59706.1 methyltransferase domain-containing protein [Mycolicibacterium farcinogenes]